jgi:hypothetical protein
MNRGHGRDKDVHACSDSDELLSMSDVMREGLTDNERDSELTIPVATYHRKIVMGSATMYRILPVKLNNKKIFPAKPQTREPILR